MSEGTKRMEARMSAKTVVAFLCGVIVASTGTAAAITKGNVFRLQQGDDASYGTVQCQAVNVAPYSGFDCWRVPRYSVIYGPSEIRVLRITRVNNRYVSRSIFHVYPSAGTNSR
jgi:hypothetical protein